MTEQEEKRERMAKAALKDPAILEVRAELESVLKDQWMLADSPQRREEIFAQLKALGDLFSVLESWTFEGELSSRTERRLAQ